ncbi:hypothetical protein [Bacteriophage Phobos]|uniref:Uncharacterized protein n=1 Tax=Bacteriophage Phobos TaxID=2662138 RepID=A0A5Q2UAC4_9CAUD|nr:hypothetical protein JT319_gp23 [Bacteriophage Phobos]QGH44992.1 hypothetical protein [Bacteriophage Phobos]WPK42388.1 hypothetical protein [Pseudomonas phage Ppu-503]
MAKTLIPTANAGMAGSQTDSYTTMELLHGDIPPVWTDYALLKEADVANLPARFILRGCPVNFNPVDRSLTFLELKAGDEANAILVHDIDLDNVKELESQGVPTSVQLYRGGSFNSQAVAYAAQTGGATVSGTAAEEAVRIAFDASKQRHDIVVKNPAHRNLDV